MTNMENSSYPQLPSDLIVGSPLDFKEQTTDREGVFSLMKKCRENLNQTDYAIKLFLKERKASIEQERLGYQIIKSEKSVFETYTVGEKYFGIVMKRGLEDTLSLINRSTKFEFGVFFPSMFQQIATQLKMLHNEGYTYFDLKFENTIVNSLKRKIVYNPVSKEDEIFTEPNVSLIDFESMVNKGNFRNQKHTITYASPEFLVHRKISPHYDSYSLGIMMYQAYTLSNPFCSSTSNSYEIKNKYIRGDFTKTYGVEEFQKLDNDIKEVINGLLDPDCEQRYTMDDFLRSAYILRCLEQDHIGFNDFYY